ncbi:hypothetical protein, partial [Flavobacterium psychrophilum]
CVCCFSFSTERLGLLVPAEIILAKRYQQYELKTRIFKPKIYMFFNSPYLKENRLSDVLALIQVLSLDKHGHRSEKGLKEELQGDPKSSENWTLLAKAHPEFFRVEIDKLHKISLVARHVIEANENGIKELSPDLIKTLIQIAIELHDRQKEKAERWKVWLPMFVALITVLSSFYIQYTNNENQAFLKHYEVELKPKQDGYTNFMKAISQSYFSAQSNNLEKMNYSLDQAENCFYIIEPFLSSHDREKIWKQYQQFTKFCYSNIESEEIKKDITKSSESFMYYKTFFRTNLYNALFTMENRE